MTNLTQHFTKEEFEKDGVMPDECIPAFTMMCDDILEPVRARYGPCIITSGYRSPSSNTAAHGVSNSEHIATSRHCAVDFKIASMGGDMRPVFDWMRKDPVLPWHQLILEHENDGQTIIHVSWNMDDPGIRSCLEGHTNNATPYTQIAYAAYHPPVEEARA